MPLRVPTASPGGGGGGGDADPVDLGGLAEGLAGYSGADIEGLCRCVRTCGRAGDTRIWCAL